MSDEEFKVPSAFKSSKRRSGKRDRREDPHAGLKALLSATLILWVLVVGVNVLWPNQYDGLCSSQEEK